MRRSNGMYQPSEHLVGARVSHQISVRLLVGSTAAVLAFWAALNYFLPEEEPSACASLAHQGKR